MKKFLKCLALGAALSLASAAGVSADDWFETKPMPIDPDNNPVSVSGTYDIERLIIKDGNNVILDSEDDRAVDDDRGEACIILNMESRTLNISFKMQMTGSVFKKGSYLAPYSFIYDKAGFNLPLEANEPLGESLEKNGITIYTMKDVKFEMPFDGGKTLILFLEKDSDKIKEVSSSRYMFL